MTQFWISKLLGYATNRTELLERSNEVFSLCQDGKLKIVVDGAFPLDKTAEGHSFFEAGKSEGNIFLLFKFGLSGDKTSLCFYCPNSHVLSLIFN